MRSTKYDGTFELGFLLNDENVQSHDFEKGSVEIKRNGFTQAIAYPGDILIRRRDHSIAVISTEPTEATQ